MLDLSPPGPPPPLLGTLDPGASCGKSRDRDSCLRCHPCLPAGRELHGELDGPLSDWVLPSTLKTINLTYNSIRGTIDPAWQLPEQLDSLALGSNRINGSLPPNWRLPDSLTYLGLSNNSLRGPLPTGYGRFPNLHELLLDGNALTGGLASQWPAVCTQQLNDLPHQVKAIPP